MATEAKAPGRALKPAAKCPVNVFFDLLGKQGFKVGKKKWSGWYSRGHKP